MMRHAGLFSGHIMPDFDAVLHAHVTFAFLGLPMLAALLYSDIRTWRPFSEHGRFRFRLNERARVYMFCLGPSTALGPSVMDGWLTWVWARLFQIPANLPHQPCQPRPAAGHAGTHGPALDDFSNCRGAYAPISTLGPLARL